jgi:flagellar basal body-associated protein FliL
MAKKKKRLKTWILIAVVIAIILCGYFYMENYFNSAIDKYNDSYSSASPAKSNSASNNSQKDAVVSNLTQFKKFGDWPLTAVDLSVGRGNPFQEKIIQEAE